MCKRVCVCVCVPVCVCVCVCVRLVSLCIRPCPCLCRPPWRERERPRHSATPTGRCQPDQATHRPTRSNRETARHTNAEEGRVCGQAAAADGIGLAAVNWLEWRRVCSTAPECFMTGLPQEADQPPCCQYRVDCVTSTCTRLLKG